MFKKGKKKAHIKEDSFTFKFVRKRKIGVLVVFHSFHGVYNVYGVVRLHDFALLYNAKIKINNKKSL